jgi:hypothetical protein
MLVHITFEKITGLKGTFEGVFVSDDMISKKLPLVFNAFILAQNQFVFTQGGKYIYLRPAESVSTINFLQHFASGVNFLVKDICVWKHH